MLKMMRMMAATLGRRRSLALWTVMMMVVSVALETTATPTPIGATTTHQSQHSIRVINHQEDIEYYSSPFDYSGVDEVADDADVEAWMRLHKKVEQEEEDEEEDDDDEDLQELRYLQELEMMMAKGIASSWTQQQQNITLWASANPIYRKNNECTIDYPCLIWNAFRRANLLSANASMSNSSSTTPSCIDIVLLGYVFPFVVKETLPIATCINVVGHKLNVSIPQFLTEIKLLFETQNVPLSWSAADFHYNVTLMTTVETPFRPEITFNDCS